MCACVLGAVRACVSGRTECALVAEVGEHLGDLVLRDVARELEDGAQRVLLVVLEREDVVDARHDLLVHVHPQRLQRKRATHQNTCETRKVSFLFPITSSATVSKRSFEVSRLSGVDVKKIADQSSAFFGTKQQAVQQAN